MMYACTARRICRGRCLERCSSSRRTFRRRFIEPRRSACAPCFASERHTKLLYRQPLSASRQLAILEVDHEFVPGAQQTEREPGAAFEHASAHEVETTKHQRRTQWHRIDDALHGNA